MGANRTKACKLAVDGGLTLLLLCLMAYQVTGEALHEWFGVFMTALLILHHLLNRRWYSALFRGKYTAYRAVTALVNTLLLASIALTALCGMAMSAHAVPFLYGLLPASFARRVHLALSFGSFLLMGLHLGLHVPAMGAALIRSGRARRILSALSAPVAGAGLWLFCQNRLYDYILFRAPFAFFDYEKPGLLVFGENLAILTAFAFLGACCAALLRPAAKKGQKRPSGRLFPLVLLALALLTGAALGLFTGDREAAVGPEQGTKEAAPAADPPADLAPMLAVPAFDGHDGFRLLSGGTLFMGSPETENWRIDDEVRRANGTLQ